MKFKILPIEGDASFRRFYRLILKKNKKIVIFAKKEKYKNLIAYTAVNKFLRVNKLCSGIVSTLACTRRPGRARGPSLNIVKNIKNRCKMHKNR